jgi:hypothetical protein
MSYLWRARALYRRIIDRMVLEAHFRMGRSVSISTFSIPRCFGLSTSTNRACPLKRSAKSNLTIDQPGAVERVIARNECKVA